MGGKTIKSKFVLVDKKDKNDKVTFEYCETKTSNAGGGPRGIDVWIEGKKGKSEYSIEPNPHDNKKYNKQPAAFYETLATAVAEAAMKTADRKLPGSISVTWSGETYKLK